MSSKLSGLSKKDNVLFHKILNLPFVSSKEKFDRIMNEVEDSSEISESELQYINTKLLTKRNGQNQN